MATLNEIAYNIKELMSGGDEKLEQNISTRQIKHWVHYHRAKIIEEKILSGSTIDRRWIQPMFAAFIFNVIDLDDSNSLHLIGNLNYLSSPNFGDQTQAFSNSEYYGNDYHGDDAFNYFSTTIRVPHTINVGQNDGLTDCRLKKRMRTGATIGRWSSWDELLVKTKDEAVFGWANKFANIKTPYLVPYNSNDKNMSVEISGLKYRPTEDSTDREFEYFIEMNGILTNPTESKKFIKLTSGVPTYDEFDDSNYNYPMSDEDLPLLISRVAEIEMALIIKTPSDLVEDNVDTNKINIGGEQRQ